MPAVPPGPLRDLMEELHDLHHRAGWPSMRAVGRAIGCSHTTISKVFSAQEPPSWEITCQVVSALGGDIRYFRGLWYQATGGGAQAWQHSAPPAPFPDGPAGPHRTGYQGAAGADAAPSAIENWLVSMLDCCLGRLPGHEVLTSLHRVDELAVEACRRQLLDDLCRHYDLGGVLPGGQGLRVGDNILHLKVGPDLAADRTLCLVIQDQRLPISHHVTESAGLGTQVGRFARLSVTSPPALASWATDICGTAVTRLIGRADQWLQQVVSYSFSHLGSPFEQGALRLFRKSLSVPLSRAASGCLFLVLVTNDRVSYAIDDTVVRDLAAAAQSDPNGTQAPAVTASDMLFNSIPFSQSFSTLAISKNRPVPVELSRAPYQNVAQDYLLAETCVYRSDSLLVPVTAGRDILMLVSYPPWLKAEMASAIPALRGELTHYMMSTQAMLRLPVIRRTERLLTSLPLLHPQLAAAAAG